MQTAGVQIVVNAQVAAALKALGVLGADGPAAFNRIEDAAKKADVAATGFAEKAIKNNRALKSAIGGIALNATMFAGPQASQFVYPLILMQKELKGLTSAAKLAGISLPGVGLAVAGITAAVMTGVEGWKAWKAQLQEAASIGDLKIGNAHRRGILESLVDSNKSRLKPGESDELRTKLAEAEQLSIAGEDAKARAIESSVRERLREVHITEDQKKLQDEIYDKAHENNVARQNEFDQLIEKERIRFEEENKRIAATNQGIKTDADYEVIRYGYDQNRIRHAFELGKIEEDRAKKEADAQRQITEEILRREKAIDDLENKIRHSNAQSTLGPRGVLDMEQMGELKLVDENVADFKRAEELKTLIREDYAARRLEIEKDEQEKIKALRDTQLTGTQTMFSNMAAAAKMYGRQGLVAYKAFAIAEATINTFKAAEAAYASVVGIPFIGPALAPMAAGAAIAAGAAQVAAINATGFVEGGYTGTGDSSQVAGVVHRNEWVIPADSVQAWGHQNMAAIQKGPSAMTGTSGGSRTINQNFHMHLDKQAQLDALRDDMEGIALDTMLRNKHRFNA